jgi:adhesin transport system outer membrane protein
LGAVFTITGAAAAGAVTLEEAVQTAVNTNPDVGVVATDRRAIDHELGQAKALYLPSLDARFAVGIENTRERAGGGLFVPGQIGRGGHARLTRQESSLTLTQLLFDGFAVASEVQRQKARQKSAALRVTETSEFTGLDAVQAYLQVLRQQELLRLAEDNAGIHLRTLEDMEQRMLAGVGGVADVRQAESRYARALATVAETRGSLEDANTDFIRVVGQPPEDLLRPVPMDPLLPVAVDQAVAIALENNPTVAVASADIATAQAELRASHSDFFPQIDLELSAIRNRNIDSVKGTNQAFRGMVVANWNLFRGGNTLALRREFVERLAEAREVLGQARRGAEEDARLSWAALKTAREREVALEAQVVANERVRDAYIDQFNIGQRSLLDVLDSENELFVSRGNLVTADFVELFAGYRLLATAGTLLNNMGVSRPSASMVAGYVPKKPAEESAPAYAAEEPSPEESVTGMEEVEPATAYDEGAEPVEPAVVVDETVLEEDTVAEEEPMAEAQPMVEEEVMVEEETTAEAETMVEPKPEGPAAPTEGFKQAKGEVTDDTLLSLNFSPLWSLD